MYGEGCWEYSSNFGILWWKLNFPDARNFGHYGKNDVDKTIYTYVPKANKDYN